MNLTVDAFEIDPELLHDGQKYGFKGNHPDAKQEIVEAVIKNLDPDSRERFEEYQKQNDPCRGEE